MHLQIINSVVCAQKKTFMHTKKCDKSLVLISVYIPTIAGVMTKYITSVYADANYSQIST